MKKTPPDPLATEGSPTDTLAVLGPVARSSVVDAVSDRLRNEILAGRLAAGSRLPSERELSLALGVNRLTLRAALARLEAMGLVTTKHGSGTEVASWRERAGLEALTMVMGSLDPDEPAWLELLTSMQEVRRILATEAVALAAVRHTDEDILAMRAIAAEQLNRIHDVQAYAHGDLEFQRAVVRAARNVGFELILNSFARFPDEQPALVAALYDKRAESVGFYDGIIALVQTRDPEGARTILRSTFAAMDEGWLARHGHRASAAKEASAGGKKTTPKDETFTSKKKNPRGK